MGEDEEDDANWQDAELSEPIARALEAAGNIEELGAIMAQLAHFGGSEVDGHILADDTLAKALRLVCEHDLNYFETAAWCQKFLADYGAVAKWFE